MPGRLRWLLPGLLLTGAVALFGWACARMGPPGRSGVGVDDSAAVGSPGPSDGTAPTDWPHLRGPRYDMVSAETGLADTWPSEGPPVLWTRELGPGYSDIVVVGDQAYTQTQSRAGQYVVCLSARSGATLWEYRCDWPWQPGGMSPGPYATPTWHGGRVYYATPSGLVGCLDAATGRPHWGVNVRRQFQGTGTEFGFAGTPLVEDGKVFLPVGGKGASLVALDAETGATAWAAGDEPASYCPVLPIVVQGRRYGAALLRNALVVFDLRTGAHLWKQALSDHYDEHAAWPLYAEPHLFIAAPFRQ